MRVSEAGLACVRRNGTNGPEFLTQWNTKWGMYSLIGGHVEAGESFRECCIREVAEELELAEGVGYSVSWEPLRPTVEYTAMSGGAKELTLYRVELFGVELLSPEAMSKVTADEMNHWLTWREVEAEATTDGKPVSAQVKTVLSLNGVL